MKLTDKGGTPITIGFILADLTRILSRITKIRTKKVEDRSPEWRASKKCKICGQDNPPEARFCANCGATLVTTVESPSPAAVPGPAPAAPEAAAEYMGFWRRLAAFIIDYLIVSATMPVIGLIVEASTGVNMGQGAIIIFPPLHFMYCVGFWTWRGQTLGKMIVGVKIVNTNGYSIGISRSILRYIGYIVSAMILYIGYFMIAWDSKKQGLHDKIASTYVIKTS